MSLSLARCVEAVTRLLDSCGPLEPVRLCMSDRDVQAEVCASGPSASESMARLSAATGGEVAGRAVDRDDGVITAIQVHGVSVLIRRRAEWGPATGVPYIHIEDQNEGPGLLLVEVNNTGEHEHPRPPSDGAAT
ncbi:hypothetical protein [Streptomyces flaveolus]|uniref:hypothetical protein n=1 Tax=Streptomyces flaveolus TaxID=67297 RepID=UPI0036F9A7FE